MADMEARSPRPLVLIAGMQENKDAAGYFANFEGIAQCVIAVTASHDSAAPAQKIAAAAQQAGLTAHISDQITDGIRAACAGAQTTPRILICGSLYLAGDVLRENG